jgi:titin
MPARSNRRPRRSTRLVLEALEDRCLPSTFLVTSTGDAGAGSLRQAILDANAAPGANEIDFAIGGGGVQTIRLSSDLPVINHSLVIDGTTQPGFAGSPLIDLDGGNTYVNGLMIYANDSTVRGLALTNFSVPDDPCTFLDGIMIAGSGNVVEGNYIGTDVTGTRRAGNSVGVMVISGSNNRIGGTTAAQRNVISGNDVGVEIFSSSSNNAVLGNYIGTDATGFASLGNGIGMTIGGADNVIGGTTAEARNVISCSTDTGLKISGAYGGADCHSNQVQGNYIGTDVTGTRALGNHEGVVIANGVNNLIGGTDPGAGNLISGNTFRGIDVSATGNVIQGNFIGTDVSGTVALGNTYYGVSISNGSNIVIGGTQAGAGNLISGNGWYGILVSSGGSNLVQGNLIGTEVSGTQPLGNGRDGVQINRSNNNTIGGEASGAGNIIAFNGGDGVRVDCGTGNAILDNAIFANGNLGIELLNGANQNQAAPVLSSATTDGASTTVSGTLTSTPNATFTLELFTSDPADPSGRQRFLGSVVVTTDADGNASFTATFAVAIDPGKFLTTTATDSANNTSAFSAGVLVSG